MLIKQKLDVTDLSHITQAFIQNGGGVYHLQKYGLFSH